MALILAIGLGLIGALLAVFLKSIAIGFAGFLGGGYVSLILGSMVGFDAGRISWIIFIIGGIIGLILAYAVLDWALIILSTLAGSALIVEALGWSGVIGMVTLIVLLALGISVQASMLRKDKH